MEDDIDNILKSHDNSLVIEVDIGPNSKVNKIIVDTNSSINFLYINTFKRMGGKIEELTPPREPIYGFTSTTALVVRTVELKLSIGSKKEWVSQTTCAICGG